MKLFSILTKFFGGRAHPAHIPYAQSPPPQPHTATASQQIPGDPTNSDGSYTEIEADIHPIAGSEITFGSEKIIIVDSNGQTKHLSKQNSHVLSTGKLVNTIEDIAGVCKICQMIAMEQFQAGELTLEQAQLASLYDTASAAICSACGFQGCSRHIRPVQTDAGGLTMCIPCQKELKKQMRKQKFIQFFLAPISETEDRDEL